MDHCDRCACRCCDHIDLAVYAKIVIYDDHCKVRCSGTYVACVNAYGICSDHACACIAFAGCNGNTCLKVACGIKEQSAVFCECACVFACSKNLRKDGEKVAACKGVELCYHFLVVIVCGRIDREHAGCFAYAHNLKAC